MGESLKAGILSSTLGRNIDQSTENNFIHALKFSVSFLNTGGKTD